MDTAQLADSIDTTLVLLTVEEAARRLQIGRTVCYRLIRSGELESITVGHLRRVPADAVPEFVTRRRKRQHHTTTVTAVQAA
ncbi:helix-turn-helix domain-containing protein [Streptomyces caniscabiei]|uniref:helix-turn-helix domain-containing protein n=1 Tax=Streptomyces caniscabiei TaxID=2746961 RepID=UPI0029AC6588|nr:helix-turn-helix domain-containing protein [Streptomyces caniscabiei]MDX2601605.1 helix-turn-helix domain-containing protein [Streptomyces caniscabiei]MDX2741817.1 helix-turn-helix domain-containing protein [Streptomyces caniscabiei]MDX2782806.1 helix-turn-helix domain-containing protein [Streptomyces caniscabiei]